LRVIEPHEAGRFAQPGLEVDVGKARAGFARGEVCAGVLHGDALVGYAWFARDAAPHIGGIWMDFDREAIYVYRAFVKREFRGRGIAAALYRAADARFMRAGRRYAILCIEVGNRPSFAAAQRSGATLAGSAGYWRAFGRFVALRSRGAANVGFRFFIDRSAARNQ
jgi:predicted GNAT family acetyltransferase